MRTRATYQDTTSAAKGPFNYISYHKDSSAWVQDATGTVPQGTDYTPYDFGESQITDDPTPARVTKSVDHKKRIVTRLPINSYDEYTDTNRYIYTGPNAHYQSWGLYGHFDHGNLNIVYDTDTNTLYRQALHKFYNQNEADNLLNIIESEQMIGSLKQLSELIRRVDRGIVNDALRSIKGFSPQGRQASRTIGHRGKNISSLYLMWQFGFAPLISDMRKVMSAVKTIKSELDKAVASAGKPYIATAKCYGEIGNLLNPPGGYSDDPHPNNNTWFHAKYDLIVRPTRSVGVKGRRSIPYKSDSFRKLDYLMRRFLSPGPISLLWERIPFSFVVDWFVDLSGIIDGLNNTLTGGTKAVSDSWSSETYKMYVSAVKHKYITWTSDADGKPTCTTYLSSYHRDPISFGSMPGLSGRFGKKQALLSAALLHQLVANLK